MKACPKRQWNIGRCVCVLGAVLLAWAANPARGADWRQNYWTGEMYFNETATSCTGVNWARTPDSVFSAWNAYLPWMGSGIWTNGNRYQEDHFASRYHGRLEILAGEEGLYRFRLRTADMGRLYIDGDLIIDADGTADYSYEEGSVTLSAGMHDIEVQHLEITGADYVLLWWSLPPPPPEPPEEGEEAEPWPPAPVWVYPPREQMWYDYDLIPKREGGAKTYYLQMDGNDANDGLARGTTRAWQTLAHACSQLLNGDRLYISKGTYTGPIQVDASGAYNSHIYIWGDTGASGIYDVVDASDVVITAPGTVYTVDNQNMQYLRYLTLDGQGHADPVVDITGPGDTLIYNSRIINGGSGGLVDISGSGAYARLYYTHLDTSTGNGITVSDDAMAYHDWASAKNIDGAVVHQDGEYSRTWSYWNTIENCGEGFVNIRGYQWPRFSLIKDIDGAVFRNESDSRYIYGDQNTIANVGIAAENNGNNRIYVYSSIISGTDGPVAKKTAGTLYLYNNLFHGYSGDPVVGQADHISTVYADPKFVSPTDFHLQADSPAIDLYRMSWSGTTLDLERRARPQGFRSDLGCYEGDAPAVPLVADLPYETTFDAGVDAYWNFKDNDDVGAYGPAAGWHGMERWPGNALTIQVNVTPGDEHVLVWDLFILDTWDQEHMQVEIDGVLLMDNMFWYKDTDDKTDFAADEDDMGDLNNNYISSSYKDKLYKNCAVRWTPSGPVSTIKFKTTTNEWMWNEAYAIDNVYINRFSDALDRYPYFQPVTISTGFKRPSASSSNGSAGFWADLDADGDIDAIVTGQQNAQLLTNDGDGKFTPSSLGRNLARNQGALGDFDNDGDPDFVVANDESSSALSLYTNDGSGTMTRLGTAGTDSGSSHKGMAAVDMNRDGLLDIVSFSQSGNFVHINTLPPIGADSVMFNTEDDADTWGALVGSDNEGTIGFVGTAEVNGDGKPDFVYFQYSGGRYRLLLSVAEDGYTASTLSMPSIGGASNGFAWGDYDNDGDQDLFVADPRPGAGDHSHLLRNDGAGNLTDVSTSAGITVGGTQRSGVWGDYDNDGDLDLFVSVAGAAPCIMYRNNGNGTFTNHDVNTTRDDGGSILDVSMADYDNDGDLDILCTRAGSENMTLYRNQCNNDNYLKVRVVGRGKGGDNAAGIGVRVDLLDAAGNLLGSRQVGGARGYAGQGSTWLHFGGVNPTGLYTLRVHFRRKTVDVPVTPSLASTTIGAGSIAQMVTLDENALIQHIRVVNYQEISPVNE